ncbi:MAG: prepilin-type N-terminal cleavage/methylation domain-containing protein [Sandaracinus sp.]|nr:prepilin-type N-terminal cleavage/methylation domain-containing protein [Sandaracinus sp.]
MSRLPRRRDRRAGFTLMEVMVAVGILALGLTAIFSSQGQAIKVGTRAQHMNIAALMARCKMAELEEQVLKEGLPAIDDSGRDGCCEDAEVEGFECEWRMDRVVLPDDSLTGEGEEGGGEGGQASGVLGDEGAQTGAIDSMLAGAGGLGGGDQFAEMAIGIAFPVMKPAIEEQVRRASVTVRWREGTSTREFDVVQYLVAEQPPRTEEPTP